MDNRSKDTRKWINAFYGLPSTYQPLAGIDAGRAWDKSGRSLAADMKSLIKSSGARLSDYIVK
jgi:hypothetical protein